MSKYPGRAGRGKGRGQRAGPPPPDWTHTLSLADPVHHLTVRNVSALIELPFAVGPKADGERALLIGDRSTSDVSLLKMSGSIVPIEGARMGSLRGFILDVEVVDGPGQSKLVLAFDVLCTQNMELSRSGLPEELISRLHKNQKQHVTKKFLCYPERREVLDVIVTSTVMKGLLVKPIADVADVRTVLSQAQRLPYSIDGLVFTPLDAHGGTAQRHNPKVAHMYKWKPPHQLTIDVALGNEIWRGEGSSLYRVYLSDLSRDGGQDNWRPDLVGTSFIGPKGHTPFHFFAERAPNPFHATSFEIDDGDDDLAFVSAKDNLEINFDRWLESEIRRGTDVCSSNDCPCGELYSSGRKLLHCSSCGALCVASTDDEQCACAVACGENQSSAIWVPSPFRDWAAFQIVEASISVDGKLQFERIRRDKRVGNTLEVANEVFDALVNPVDIDELSAAIKPVGKMSHKTSLHAAYRRPATMPPTAKAGSFASLRNLHSSIKKWLYEVFGGARIVDACTGGLHDIENWRTSGCRQVLAIDRDGCLLRKGQPRIDNNEGVLQVEIVEADLSGPLDGDVGSSFRNQSSAVFCHFSLHYFWGSPLETNQFFSNIVPFLVEGGYFVATVLKSDIFDSSPKVCIYDDDGAVAFEATKTSDGSADVCVASIGKHHTETIIEEEIAKERLAQFGLVHVTSYPFEDLQNLFPHITASLSKSEMKMSSLYTTYIFVKKSLRTTGIREGVFQQQSALFSEMPDGVERSILLYFDIPSLVSEIRRISQAARVAVDTLPIPDRASWFGSSIPRTVSSVQIQEWSSASIGLFLRMGGNITSVPLSTTRTSPTWDDHSDPGGYRSYRYGYNSDYNWDSDGYNSDYIDYY